VLKLGWSQDIQKIEDFKNLTYLEINSGCSKHFKGLDNLIEAVFKNVPQLDLSELQPSSTLKKITLRQCSVVAGKEIPRGVEDITLIATTIPDFFCAFKL
jgi:hypothetical protein